MADRVIEELDEDQCLEPDIRGRDRPDRVRQPVRAGCAAGELRAAGRGGRVPHRGERPAR